MYRCTFFGAAYAAANEAQHYHTNFLLYVLHYLSLERVAGLPHNFHSKFPDFSLNFENFPDPDSHLNNSKILYKYFMLVDLIVKEKSKTKNTKKRIFLNIN